MAQVSCDTDNFFTDLLSLDATAFYKFSQLTFDDPPAAAGVHSLHTFGLDLAQEWIALDILSVIYGGNLQVDVADSTQIGRKNRVSGGVFIEMPIYPLSQLGIIPVVRYDWYSDFPGSFNFKLSSVYAAGESIALKLSGGSSYRAPTFNDLYWPASAWEQGNPNLTPETGYYGEMGLSAATERLSLDAFAFARYLKDAIQWAETGLFFWEPLNVGQLFYPGFEMNAEMNLLSALWLTGDYTFLYSFVLEGATATYDFEDNKRVPYAPVHSFDVALEYRGDRLHAGVSGEYVGSYYTDDANTTEQDAYFVLDALLRYQASEILTLQAGVDNLLNSTYEAHPDYIATPISFRLGAELTL
jgi:outer membrane cobalamin receptor